MDECIRWTKEEIEFLEESWGTKSKKSIAKHLGRTEAAVRHKAIRLGLGNWLHTSDYITVYELLNILGITYGGDVLERLKKHGFPSVKKVPHISASVNVIYLDKFWKWAEKNQDAISFKNFEYGALGIEPGWVNDKRARDKHKKNTRWTPLDDEILKSMAKQYKYTAEEMAKRLQRSEPSILRRLYDLKIPERPICKRRDNDVVAV